MYYEQFELNYDIYIFLCQYLLNYEKFKYTLICKKSRVPKVTAQPCTGKSSFFSPLNATFVRTANATGFVYNKNKLLEYLMYYPTSLKI